MDENITTAERNGSYPTQLPDEAQGESTRFRISKIFFYFLILSCSTFGNSMVAHIISNSRKMRTASNFLILNLAICDLVTPLISIVFDFILEENNYEWIYGGVMCKLLWPAQTYFTCASSLTLAVISLDRYRIIMHPFKIRLSTKQICILICLVHVFSLVAVAPYSYVLALRNGSCDENWPEFTYRQAYTFSLFLVQYGLPLVFMVVMYSLALRALCNTSARTRGNSISAAHTPRFIVKKLKLEAKEQKKRHRVSRTSSVFKRLGALKTRNIWNTPNARATKMFIVVVVVFAIFMFPNQVVWLWADFGGGINSPNFTNLSIICWLFTYTNCVVNPVIFGVFSKDFRKGFKRIFERLVCCERSGAYDVERSQLQSCTTKTGSESIESNGLVCEQYGKDDGSLLLFPIQVCDQTTGLDVKPPVKPNKHFHEKATPSSETPIGVDETTVESFNSQDSQQTLNTSMLMYFINMPEGESRNLNDHLRMNYVEQWAVSLPNSISETLKDALNCSPETNC